MPEAAPAPAGRGPGPTQPGVTSVTRPAGTVPGTNDRLSESARRARPGPAVGGPARRRRVVAAGRVPSLQAPLRGTTVQLGLLP